MKTQEGVRGDLAGDGAACRKLRWNPQCLMGMNFPTLCTGSTRSGPLIMTITRAQLLWKKLGSKVRMYIHGQSGKSDIPEHLTILKYLKRGYGPRQISLQMRQQFDACVRGSRETARDWVARVHYIYPQAFQGASPMIQQHQVVN